MATDFTPEQSAWLGGADPTDPYILARMNAAIPNPASTTAALEADFANQSLADSQAMYASQVPPTDADVTAQLKEDAATNNASPEDAATTEGNKASESVTSATSSDNTSNAKYIGSDNVLFDYSSYTYNISLHALTSIQFQDMNEFPGSFTPEMVLISSAGRRGDSMPRHPEFNEDFFFEKLTMETVIGMSAQTRNTNAISISFTIIEPFGLTLLNRIIQAAKDSGYDNFKGRPYLLMIDFFGYNADSVPVKIPNITKYIPIQFIEFKMNVTSKGGTYNISAVPFGHQGFSTMAASVPIKLEVMAKNVGQFFIANDPHTEAVIGQIADATNATNAAKAEAERTQAVYNNQTAYQRHQSDTALTAATTAKSAYEGLVSSVPAPKRITSYASAINTWYKTLKTDQDVEIQDIVSFEIDPEIADAEFPDAKDIGKDNIEMKKPDDTQYYDKTNRFPDSTTGAIFPINSGTQITDVIGMAVRNSSYIRKQFEGTRDPKAPINWFKIVPKVKLLDYDHKRKAYAKNFIYGIQKYTAYNTNSTFAPLGKPTQFVKQYDYIFTGNNRDIIDLEMTFDTTYFTINTVKEENLDAENGAKENAGKTPETAAASNNDTPIDALKPVIHHTPNQNQALSSGANSTEQRIAQFQTQMLSHPSGDMLAVDLKIVGDPVFIKQDDIFFSNANAIQSYTPNGSVAMDAGEVFCKLRFLTPTDYNANGLENPNEPGKYTTSVFSGLYKIITVESTFSNGKFEQLLHLVRYDNQAPGGEKPPASTGATNRDVPTATTAPPATQEVTLPDTTNIADTNSTAAQDLADQAALAPYAPSNTGDALSRKLAIGESPTLPLNQAQQNWIGNADQTDPYILSRMAAAVPDNAINVDNGQSIGTPAQ